MVRHARWLMATFAIFVGAGCNDRPPSNDEGSGGFTGEGTSGVGDADAGDTGDDAGDGGEPEPEPSYAPCNGDSRAELLSIEAVQPPGDYELPTGDALRVVSSALELAEAVAEGVPDIVLEDGVYDLSDGPEPPEPLRINSQRLWSQTPGGAKLRFGVLAVGSGGGAELHGLVFESMRSGYEATHVDAQGEENHYAVVGAGAAGRGLVVEDCWFDGGDISEGALRLDNPAGVRLSRLDIRNYRRAGIELGRDEVNLGADESSSPTPQLEDLNIEAIRPVEGAEGDARFAQWGLRLRDRAEVRRVRVREVGWSGIVLSHRTEQSQLESIDIDEVRGDPQGDDWGGSTGVSFDETSRDVRLRRFCVGPETRIGVNGQWHGEPQPALHAVRPVLSQGLIQSRRFGVHFDAGSVAVVAFDLIIENYGRAGVVFFRNLDSEELLDTTPVDPDDPNAPNPAAAWSEGASVQYDNEFSPSCASAPAISLAHWNSHETCDGS